MVPRCLFKVVLAILYIESANGFVNKPMVLPPIVPTARENGNAKNKNNNNSINPSNTQLYLFGRNKNKQTENKVQVIEANGSSSSSDGKATKDVVATIMDNPNSAQGRSKFIEVEAKKERTEFAEETDYDVVVVGAGCAGVGTALMLTRTFGLDSKRVINFDQGKHVGESFRNWPEEMRFISPSFNQQGWTESFDLNAIHYDTSPAFMLRSEHPSGEEYALYLEAIAQQGGLNVQLETKVLSVKDVGTNKESEDRDPGPFEVQIQNKDGSSKTLTSRYIVWAAGEFQFPKDKRIMEVVEPKDNETKKNGKSSLPKMKDVNEMFPGAELCLHNSKVKSWKNLEGDEHLIIGGYESGVDAAVNLARAGKHAKVLASTACWDLRTGDPSSELAPYTSDRLRDVLSTKFDGPSPKLMAPLRVIAVDKAPEGGYNVAAEWKPKGDEPLATGIDSTTETEEVGEAGSIIAMHTPNPPILATGFEGSVAAQAGHLFAFPDPNAESKGCAGDGPLLTKRDESTRVKGVFLVGPTVSHGDLVFCFVYKFRQRFAVVANAICEGLGMDTTQAVMECRRTNMYLDNFATCEDTCGDAC